MEKLNSSESDGIRKLSGEVRSMNDPLERVKRILEEVANKGAVMEVYPELLTILVNNTQSIVEETERLRKYKQPLKGVDINEKALDVICYNTQETAVLKEFDNIEESLVKILSDIPTKEGDFNYSNICTPFTRLRKIGLIDKKEEEYRGKVKHTPNNSGYDLKAMSDEILKSIKDFNIEIFDNYDKLFSQVAVNVSNHGEKENLNFGYNCNKPKLDSALKSKLVCMMDRLKKVLENNS